MIAAAREFFLLEERLSRELEDIAGDRAGRITVGASVTRGAYIIPSLFASFKQEYPDVELVLKEGSNNFLLDLVLSGEVDFAFVGSADSNFKQIFLKNNELLLAVPKTHPVLKSLPPGASAVSLELFDGFPFILLHKGQALRNIVDGIFKDHGMKPSIAYETHSYDIAYQMAAAGLGCTFIIENAPFYNEGAVTFHLEKGIYSYPLLMVYRKNAYLSAPMKHLIRLAQQMF